MFFSNSGEKKRIDYVLVYGRDSANDPRRIEFEEMLKQTGIELEYEDIEVKRSTPCTQKSKPKVPSNLAGRCSG